MSAIIKAPPRALVPVANAAEARARVTMARERLVDRLHAVEMTLGGPRTKWGALVKKHPILSIGGALLVGYAISRLFSRK